MINIGPNTRLTDSLERKLMAQAMEEQMRAQPGKAIKAFFSRILDKLNRDDQPVSTDVAQTAN